MSLLLYVLYTLKVINTNVLCSHVCAGLQHVVSMPPRNWDESNGSRVVANLLDVSADFLGDLLKASLAVWGLGGVHLVDSNDKLLHSQGEGQEGMLTGLSILGDTSLKLTHTGSNDQHSTIGLSQKYLKQKS